jgi:TPP-dependent indolepyruvate ferredoxin oxidoreductase alpha subunit
MAKIPCLEPVDSEEARVYVRAAFELSRTYLSGVLYSKKKRKISSHFVLPLSAGLLEPSYDRKIS